jgi:hypothetical protein
MTEQTRRVFGELRQLFWDAKCLDEKCKYKVIHIINDFMKNH